MGGSNVHFFQKLSEVSNTLSMRGFPLTTCERSQKSDTIIIVEGGIAL
jgi:hypothetical protein